MKKTFVALIFLLVAIVVAGISAAPATHNTETVAIDFAILTVHDADGTVTDFVILTDPAGWRTVQAEPDWSSILAHNSYEMNVTSSDAPTIPERKAVERALDQYGTANGRRADAAARSRPLRC